MKRLLVKLGFYSGLFRLWPRNNRGDTFQVLMYHHVTERSEPLLPHVTIEVFCRQVHYLNLNYRIVALDELVKKLKTHQPIPARSLALTFDDGYEDYYHNAFPVLKQLKIPATVFCVTGFIDTDLIPWTDELSFMLRETKESEITLERNKRIDRVRWKSRKGRWKALQAIKKILKSVPEDVRFNLYQQLKKQLAVKRANPGRILRSDQIREMAASGIRFGAHTINHYILTRVPPAVAREEIEGSKLQLEGLTGHRISGFCYPNGEAGDFNEETKKMLRQAGFDYACTAMEGVNSKDADLYALKRSWTSEPSLPVFAARLLSQKP